MTITLTINDITEQYTDDEMEHIRCIAMNVGLHRAVAKRVLYRDEAEKLVDAAKRYLSLLSCMVSTEIVQRCDYEVGWTTVYKLKEQLLRSDSKN